jgi:hypothetical protein
MRTYGEVKCGVCGQIVKHSGQAMASHFRRHVRSGEYVQQPNTIPLKVRRADRSDDDFRAIAAYFG